MTSPLGLAHSQRVARLYRQALREARNWNPVFELYREKCLEIRERFDKNRNITNPLQVERLVGETEKELKKWRHNVPYTYPTAPEGSKWERNIPPPEWALRLTVQEYEWLYGHPPPAGYHAAGADHH